LCRRRGRRENHRLGRVGFGGGGDGQKSLVCTIDPAKRLANALGVEHLGNREICMPAEWLAQAGISSTLSFWAMMLDMKHAWDELISNHATDCQKTHIFNNRFYQSLSGALAGSQEYIAIEKLWELKRCRDYGLVVLDTPPIAHALDFLDAPSRLLGFLDTDASKHLFLPMLSAGRWGFRKANNNLFTKALSRFVGLQTLEQLSEFLLSMGQLYGGFRERARQTQALLEEPGTAFVVVTTPHPERISGVQHFLEVLQKRNLQIAAVVVNQMHLPLGAELLEELQALPEPLAQKMELTCRAHEQQAFEDAQSLQKLQALCQGIPLKTIPALESTPSELERLWQISQTLQRPS
jgi:anion-transporting  ArsA/GET3 family ATPase